MRLTRYFERRRFGAYLIAVRENEAAAEALGVDALRVKLQAIVVSAALDRDSPARSTRNISCSSTPTSASAPGSRSRR